MPQLGEADHESRLIAGHICTKFLNQLALLAVLNFASALWQKPLLSQKGLGDFDTVSLTYGITCLRGSCLSCIPFPTVTLFGS